MLGKNIGIHAAAITTGTQKVVDIQADGSGTNRIFTAKVDDGACRDLFTHGDIRGESRCLLLKNPFEVVVRQDH